MQPIITDNREKIIEICKAHYVCKVSAFGSAVRDDFDDERSDVDLFVEFQVPVHVRYAPNYFALCSALTGLLNRKVDVVISSTIRNKYILRRINEQKELLYAA